MAQYQGLVSVDISSFQAFKDAVNGNGYDVDGLFGDQCVDMPKLLAGNAGRPSPYWKSGSLGYAKDGWLDANSREYNKGDLFTLVYNKEDVRVGDLVVLDNTSSNPYGHIAFATTNWDASTTTAPLLGQNQVNASATTGHPNTITNVNISNFLGAFRFIAWQPTPPPPPSSRKKNKYPFVLYANRLRQKRQMF